MTEKVSKNPVVLLKMAHEYCKQSNILSLSFGSFSVLSILVVFLLRNNRLKSEKYEKTNVDDEKIIDQLNEKLKNSEYAIDVLSREVFQLQDEIRDRKGEDIRLRNGNTVLFVFSLVFIGILQNHRLESTKDQKMVDSLYKEEKGEQTLIEKLKKDCNDQKLEIQGLRNGETMNALFDQNRTLQQQNLNERFKHMIEMQKKQKELEQAKKEIVDLQEKINNLPK